MRAFLPALPGLAALVLVPSASAGCTLTHAGDTSAHATLFVASEAAFILSQPPPIWPAGTAFYASAWGASRATSTVTFVTCAV